MKNYILTGYLFGLLFGLAVGIRAGFYDEPSAFFAAILGAAIINGPVGAFVGLLVGLCRRDRQSDRA